MIKEARKGRFSQQSLGEQIGVWGTYIGQIEKGERIPSEELCLKLAKILELDVRKLLIAAYLERAESSQVRQLFQQMDKLLTDPIVGKLLSNRDLLDPELFAALEQPELRSILKDEAWRAALVDAVSMSERDLPSLIRVARQMTPQQWEALLNTAKAMAGIP
ncbi:MAG: helix-turn-helix transcriptional regulator [bacterium]|nr:helix-turn-helix transcriptional regulator [bacterium]